MNRRLRGAIQKKLNDIATFVYADAVPIRDVGIWETKEHVTPEEAQRQRFEPCSTGRTWGGPWATAWFRIRFALPASLARRNAVARIAVGGEGVAFIRGEPVVGLNRHRDEVWLPRSARRGQEFEILVEAGANDDFGKLKELPRVERLELASVREQVRQLCFDLEFLLDMLDQTPENGPRFAEIVYLLDKATRAFDFDAADPDREAARVRRILRPLFARRANASSTEMILSGHAHLDVIWLWPLAETTRKCARTFSSMVAYFVRYPDFRFTQTQAYLYEETRRRYPKLYRRICDAVRAGKWEVSTGMYVEADTNIPSGESLVRQVMFGKRFSREEFGIETDVLVLPDVFGYSAALPQILRKAGIEFFTTQKLTWNDTNRFPYNSFRWEGIDGSEVLAHFLPSESYGGSLLPRELARAERNHAEKGQSKLMLDQYGFSDGGGPTPRMIEYGRRARNFEGLPRCRFGFIRDFFHALRRDTAVFPRWVGELYLECHRGCFTTHAKNKLLNRRSELTLREAELFGAIDLSLGGRYDQREIHDCWKTVLLNQFHDVLPGSSIREVYELSEKQLADVVYRASAAAQKSAQAIAKRIDTSGEGVPVIVWNPLAWRRPGPVQIEVPEGMRRPCVINSRGEPVPVQRVGGREILFYAFDVPAMGYEVYRLVSGAKAAAAPPLRAGERTLENRFLRVRVNANGELTSLFDKVARREVLHGGVGNELQFFHDRPHNYDAWEVDWFSRDERLPLPPADSVRLVESGPVRAAIEVRRRIGKSSFLQRIVLWSDAARVDFETQVDWHEAHKLLKVAFPVDVRSPRATYEIQFGSVERPTHTNTTWDAAMWEVPAQRWADLSDASYGASILNDCKYGHDIRGNVMRLTLLRAPKTPDPTADMGKHAFRYSLLPHTGDHRDAGTVRAGWEFNVPLRHTAADPRPGGLPAARSFFEVDGRAVVLDTVKKAGEDGAIVVRLYEAHGGRAHARLSTALPVASAVECDLLERRPLGKPIRPKDGSIELDFGPFEIKTLKLELG